MANANKKDKLPRLRKTPESVRERAEKEAGKQATPRKRIRGKIHRPLSVLRKVGQKEYNPIPVPENKVGRILGKRIHIFPKYFRNAWGELKQVTWPTKVEAARLTSAVIIFAVIFAVFVQVLSYGFDKLFKEILLK